MRLDLRANGIHSMIEALKAFKKFHDEPDDPNVSLTLKDTILRSHHALEALFKNTLLQYNSALLLERKYTIGEFVDNYQKFLSGDLETELDEVRTISLKATIQRLRKFGLLKIDEKEYALFYDAVEKLDRYRNRLQHFMLSADPDVIARMLGIALPRAIDILDSIPPYDPTLGNTRREQTIWKILEVNFPDAISTIQLLRSNYDSLIDQAVSFFKKKTFSGEKLELSVEDNGTGFWGPPELKVKGFLNFQTERYPPVSESITDYAASTEISDPTYSGMGTFPFEGRLKGSIDFHAEIKFRKAEGFLLLPESEEKVAFLRDFFLTVDANLQYEAEGIKGGGHFDIHVGSGKFQASKGNLRVLLKAVPRGYEGEKPKIVGRFETILNEKNAPFNVHCFLQPDGGIRDENRHLEWKLKTVGVIVFD